MRGRTCGGVSSSVNTVSQIEIGSWVSRWHESFSATKSGCTPLAVRLHWSLPSTAAGVGTGDVRRRCRARA
eukprot:scaffold15925_cov54-Phaeocystis_antarctica.AAC.7